MLWERVKMERVVGRELLGSRVVGEGKNGMGEHTTLSMSCPGGQYACPYEGSAEGSWGEY